MKKHLFYAFLAIFVATATVTLCGVTGRITVLDGYLTPLMTAFIIELGAAVIALFHRTDFFPDEPAQTALSDAQSKQQQAIAETVAKLVHDVAEFQQAQLKAQLKEQQDNLKAQASIMQQLRDISQQLPPRQVPVPRNHPVTGMGH